MSKVLFITANPAAEETSFSLSIGQSFLQAYCGENPADEIVKVDVYAQDIPLIDSDILSAWGALRGGAAFETLTADQQLKLTKFDALTDQFVSADKYIIVSPMWNLGIPPLLKAYIDTVIVAGKTFRYTEAGPQGLLAGKKGIHIHARGGMYSGDAAAFDFADSYVRSILSFIGVEMMDSIIAEGMAYAPDKAGEIKQAAIELGRRSARELAAV